MYFVVMQNLFNEGPVHQRFDLKGNRDRRQAICTNQVENYMQMAKEQRMIKKLMMDIDFRKFSGGVCLSAENARLLQGQICDDIVFLASRGIIDYSILLGVRYLNSREKIPSIAGQSQGLYSNDLEKVYYIGLVDMLQRYNWRWTVQRWLLGILLCKDTHDVSAVPPAEYGTRLTEFVRSRLFDVESLDCDVRVSPNDAYSQSRFISFDGNSQDSSSPSAVYSYVPKSPTQVHGQRIHQHKLSGQLI
jgi:1-phosphatidylinositol-4-phosphate 5-kinase